MKAFETDRPRILIADDQSDIREALRLLLKAEGYRIETAGSPAAVVQALERGDYALVLMDLNYARDTTSGQEGLDLLARIQAFDPVLPVVVMTAWGSVELAVAVMQRGARDFVQKPWENARLLATVRTQVELGRALRDGRRLEAENRVLRDQALPPLIAESAAMKPVLQLLARVAPSDANVLITGESGTGKGVVARHLHALSPRAARPLITLNTGGLPESVFESELFGHVKGAFTDAKADRVGRFELADGGTLFLDEIANIPPAHQGKLLHVVESGEFERLGASRTLRVNVRVLSATNADLQAEIAAGRFRQDLLFRLNTITIHLPPLRDRPEDIPLLAGHFLEHQARRYRRNVSGFDEAALEALRRHSWAGNIRELSHSIERAVLMARGARVNVADLGLSGSEAGERALENLSLEEVERFLVKKALARFDGNASRAAEALGLSRSAFYRRQQRHGL